MMVSMGKLHFMYVMTPFVTRGFCTEALHTFSNPIMRDSE
jgi:hypothetical protein